MIDERHKIDFVGAGPISGSILERIKEEFEKTIDNGFQDEFEAEIELEWVIDEDACYVSRVVFDVWEEDSEEMFTWIYGFFLSAVEETAERLDEDGLYEEAKELRFFYLPDMEET